MPICFFRAAPAELRRTFRGWKEPLSQPVKRARSNPFTRTDEQVWSWDPSEKPAHRLTDFHLPCTDMIHDGLAFEGFAIIELSHVLLPTQVAETVERDLFPQGAAPFDARFARPALVGPFDGPWIWQMPSALVTRLSTMTAAEILAAAPRWVSLNRESKERHHPGALFDDIDDAACAEFLRKLRDLGETALANDEGVYELLALD